MPDGAEIPPGPSTARVRDCLLRGDGSRALAADRDLAETLERRFPGRARAVRDAHAFTGRAVTWAAHRGIGQFIVAGCGLPAPGGVRDAARAVIPAARIAYAGAGAAVLAYAQLEAAADDGTAVLDYPADDPAGLLASPGLAGVINLAAVACVVLPLVLHFLTGARARETVARLAAGLAPGSCLVLSVAIPDRSPEADEFIAAWTPARICRHSVQDVEGWLEGLDVVVPGVADVRGWRAGMPEPRLPRRPLGKIVGAVAVVPGQGRAGPG